MSVWVFARNVLCCAVLCSVVCAVFVMQWSVSFERVFSRLLTTNLVRLSTSLLCLLSILSLSSQHEVDVALCDVIRPCTVNFVQPPTMKAEDAERQTQGRDNFYCRMSIDPSGHFQYLPRRKA